MRLRKKSTERRNNDAKLAVNGKILDKFTKKIFPKPIRPVFV